jgi:hypothetical protein
VSWYTWLEQGRDIKVSDSVLDAVSRALQLEEPERAHLYRLAGLNPPHPQVQSGAPETARLQRVVDGWLTYPAYVIDPYWTVIVTNRVARSVFGVTGSGYNCLVTFFTDPEIRMRYPDGDETARQIVAQLRAQAARVPGDRGFRRLISRLLANSPEFASLWSRHEIHETFTGLLRFQHAGVGQLTFEQTAMHLAEHANLRLMLYMPSPGTDTQTRMEPLTRPLDGTVTAFRSVA